MVVHTDVEASLRLQCADLLLTALDHCRDVIQVTDSQDRVIYENNSTEKILGYSSSDWFEKSIWDFQTTIGLTESVLNENETTTIKGMHNGARNFLKKSWQKKLVKSNQIFFREIAFLALLNFFPVQKLIFGHF